jgi:hypothetical protein
MSTRSQALSFLDVLPETTVQPGEVVEAKVEVMRSDDQDRQDDLRRLEDELLVDSLAVVRGAIDFASLDPDDLDTIPPEWIETMGLKKATYHHRVARAAWSNAKEAPVGMKIAKDTAMGVIKAKATDRLAARPLNVGVIMMAPMQQFNELEVDE